MTLFLLSHSYSLGCSSPNCYSLLHSSQTRTDTSLSFPLPRSTWPVSRLFFIPVFLLCVLEKADWWVSEGGPPKGVVSGTAQGGRHKIWKPEEGGWGQQWGPEGETLIPKGRGGKGSKGKIKAAEILVATAAHLLPLCRFHIHILSYSPTPSRRNVLSKAEKRTVFLSRTCLWTVPRCACEDILVTFLAREGKLFRQKFVTHGSREQGILH